MSIAIDPLIRIKLEQFISRRRRWAWLHALLLAIVVWLVGVLLFTWIDAVWILERGTRSFLSIMTYAVAMLAGITLAMRRIGHEDPLRRAAIEIEKERPELRDQLLSAVELASPTNANGSQSFIAAAQGMVAGKVRGLDVRSLLPLNQLSRPMAFAGTAVFGCLLLVLLPQLQYGNRFARAIIPGFDIDRISRTKIFIERPAPPSRTVPADEITAIVVRLEGAIASSATLQWKADDGSGGKVKMHPSGSASDTPSYAEQATFAANLLVSQSPVSYRIMSGDGVTRWQQLEPRFRPEVIEFETQLTPPRYTQLPTESAKASDGNLTGLAGSMVSLRLRFNMPVQEVVMRRMNTDRRLPMQLEGDLWVINTVIDFDDRYQVLATAVETGFDNPLSPQYAITPILDNPPIARWRDTENQTPSNTMSGRPRRELVTAFSKVNLSAAFRDEMPMERVEQEIAINGGPWQVIPLEGPLDQAQVIRDWQWDLQLMRYKDRELAAGDVIQTRVAATDRRGLRGESATKEFIVSDQEFDNSKRERLSAWLQVAASINEWKKAIRLESMGLNIEETPTPSAPAPAPAVDAAAEAAIPRNDEAARNERQTLILAMIEKAATDSEAAKLELAARAIRHVEHAMVAASEANESKRRDFRSITSTADAIAESIKAEVAHQLGIVMTDNLLRMSASIQPIMRKSDPIDWTTFGRYFEVTKEQFEELSEVIEATTTLVPDSTRQHNTNLLRWIDESHRRLADTIKQGNSESVMRETARHTTTDLHNRRYQGLIDSRIGTIQIELMKRLQNAVGWMRQPLEEMVKLSEEIHKAAGKANKDNSDDVRAAKEKIAALNENLQSMQAIVIARLKQDGVLHQGRPEADQRYVADTHLLERVLDRVADVSYIPPSDKNLTEIYREIASAYHWLEAGHRVTQWGRELRTLADDDRWNANSPSGRIDAPNRIERFTGGLEFSASGLQQAGMPAAELEPIKQLRSNELVNEIIAEITSRRWSPKDAISAADKLERHHANFLIATTPLDAYMKVARSTLESYLPSIAELARKTAATLEESKPKQDPKNDAKEERKREQQKREEAIAQADRLKESLTDEANTQELMTDEGRSKARNADISLKAIEKRMEELQAAADNAVAASASEEPEATQSLREQTEKAISALEQIAKHYEQEYPESGVDSESAPNMDSPLKQLEEELGLTQSLDQQFARSDAIAKALQSDPRELLKKLQQELKRNPLMQKELGEITDQTLAEAQRALEQQAGRERELQLQLEKSDPKLSVIKRELEEAIRRSGELTQEVERSLMAAANQAAQSLRDLPELSKLRAEATNRDLQSATANIRTAVNDSSQVGSADNQLLSELTERSERIADMLDQAVEALRLTEQPLTEILNDETASLDDKRRNDERRNMENVQRRARDNQVQIARDQQRRAAQRQQRQEQEVRSAKQRLQRETESLQRAETKQKQDPNNPSLAGETARLLNEVKNAATVLDAAQSIENLAKQASDASKLRADEIGKTAVTPLDQSQPAAQLAQMMQRKADAQLAQTIEMLSEATEGEANDHSIQPKSNAVSSATKTQQKVAEAVEEIAEDMARAARHHQRLGDVQLAQATAQASDDVKSIAEGEVAKASQSLQAANEAMTSEQVSTDAGKVESTQAQTSLRESQLALSEQAQRLGEANAAMNAQSLADAQAAAAQSAAEADAARQKAQTLDELDRSISASQKSAQQSDQPSSAESESPSSPSPSPATLSAAARKQAQAMAKKRSQQAQGQAPSQGEGEPSTDATESGEGTSSAMADFFNLEEINRIGDDEWGKLRVREAEDVAEERRVEISPEYRKQIEAYFRVIAEKAKQ